MTAADVRTLEACADELMRRGSAGHAVKLWALALKARAELNMPPETVSVGRG